jgi:hypothetical protein
MFDALLWYVLFIKDARKYLSRIFLKLDLKMMKGIFKSWI